MSPKDKSEKGDQCGVVYQIPCKDCTSSYIGESERALKTRLKEHRRNSNQDSSTPATSAVAEHMRETAHHIEWDQVKILDRDSRWYERGVREAIAIRKHPRNLNRDMGRHLLSRTYNTLLKPCDLNWSQGTQPSTWH